MKVKVNLDEVLYHKIIESLIRGEYAVGEKIMLNHVKWKGVCAGSGRRNSRSDY